MIQHLDVVSKIGLASVVDYVILNQPKFYEPSYSSQSKTLNVYVLVDSMKRTDCKHHEVSKTCQNCRGKMIFFNFFWT